MKRTLVFTALLWILAAGPVLAMDTIYVPGTDKDKEKAFFGEIVSMSATVINFKSPKKDAPSEFATNEIIRITFENSPPGLLDAQKSMLRGDYDRALDSLKSETTEDKRPEVADEIKFCRAYCAAQLTLSGEADLTKAGQEMFSFIKNSPNSFHYYKACESMGDLLVSADKFAAAQEYYAKLAQAPWPDYKMRAQVALGRAYLAQGNAAAADKAFDEALNNDAPGDLAEAQRTAARIGKARCLIVAGKADAAIKTVNEIIDHLDERNPEINAMAYNALGTALRKAGKPDKAILAFLRVHLMYDMQPDAHAEAVANLAKLFAETHKPLHVTDMQKILSERYSQSRWARAGAVK